VTPHGVTVWCVVSRRRLAAAGQAVSAHRRSRCVERPTQRYVAGAARRRLQVLRVTARIAAGITGGFGVLQLATGETLRWIGIFNVFTAALFLVIPRLHRYGPVLAPVTFVVCAYASLVVAALTLGTASGAQFFFLVSAAIVLLVLGIERLVLAAVLVGIGAALGISLEFLVPDDTGAQPAWLLTVGFAAMMVSGCFMSLATVWVALRAMARAEAALASEYHRSETLLTNILPATVAERLKDASGGVLVDEYADASVLFADIADFTEHAGDMTPEDLVRFLDLLYTRFDLLVEKHQLEKIKTSGDSYMVVSGVPQRRGDHLAALARFALDMAEAAAQVRAPQGWPLRIRIGMAVGPVVAGVIGSRRFFYDVWGDAVNVAARMESTDTEGRIQVPQGVYERLRDDFVFEERGEIVVKGKGRMRTWFLIGPKAETGTVRAETVLTG